MCTLCRCSLSLSLSFSLHRCPILTRPVPFARTEPCWMGPTGAGSDLPRVSSSQGQFTPRVSSPPGSVHPRVTSSQIQFTPGSVHSRTSSHPGSVHTQGQFTLGSVHPRISSHRGQSTPRVSSSQSFHHSRQTLVSDGSGEKLDLYKFGTGPAPPPQEKKNEPGSVRVVLVGVDWPRSHCGELNLGGQASDPE